MNRRLFLKHCAAASLAGLHPFDFARAEDDDTALAQRLSDEAIAARKLRVVRAIAADPSFNPRRNNPKYQHALVGARLALNPNDAAALEWIKSVAAFDDMFAYQGLAANFGRFGGDWSAELVEAIRQSVTSWKGFLGGGTENMVAMRRAAGLIFGERFPEEKFQYGLTGRQLVEECKAFMRRYSRAVFGGSMVEYLSPIYVATNSAAWLNVAEFAQDDEGRFMAEALLDWIYADVAANSFECSCVAPVQREKGLLTGSYQRSFPATNTQWVSWMFFGGGNVPEGDGLFPSGHEPYKAPIGFHAVSKWSPSPVIRNIAAHRVALPYSLRQAKAGWGYIEPTMANAFGRKEPAAPGKPELATARHDFRSAYFHRDYAIGTGTFRTDPEEPLTRTVVPFGVWWRSANENNFLLVAHPFWFAEMHGDEGEPPLGDNDWLGISPFCRTVHHENAAVLLYDLPEKDPYLDLPEHGGAKGHVKRSGRIIKSIFVYLPETVHERVQTEAGFFVREGDVYFAVRPLTHGARWAETSHRGFVRIEVPGAITGVAIEVGDRVEYGSFGEFQSKVAAARLDVARLQTEKQVGYSSSRGHELKVASVPGTWLPEASIDGTRLDFARWPISESPYLRSEDRVVDIADGRAGFSIDWRGDSPVYTYRGLHAGARASTSRRFIRDGRLVVE